MRIDSHQHFWHYSPAEHVWMTDAMPGLKRDYLPTDLLPLLQANGLEGAVAVQARQNLKETLAGIKSSDAIIAGMFQEFGDQVGMNAHIIRDLIPA